MGFGERDLLAHAGDDCILRLSGYFSVGLEEVVMKRITTLRMMSPIAITGLRISKEVALPLHPNNGRLLETAFTT
jgi:hypothetical protein